MAVRYYLGKPRFMNNFTGTRPQFLSVERECVYRLDPRQFSSFDHLQDANEFADKLHVHLFLNGTRQVWFILFLLTSDSQVPEWSHTTATGDSELRKEDVDAQSK